MTPCASTPWPDHLGFLTSRMSHGLFPKLSGNEDREVLRKAGICFRCRQPGHMSMECPEGNKEHGRRSIIKVESVEQPVVESDQESSPYIPIPTIRIPVRIADAKTPALRCISQHSVPPDCWPHEAATSPSLPSHLHWPSVPPHWCTRQGKDQRKDQHLLKELDLRETS